MQKELPAFVSILLLKQYYFHLANYHQGYDLLAMRTGNAKIIIEQLISFAGLRTKNLEMLNSGYIVDYVKSNKEMSNNKTIMNLRNKVSDLSIQLQ
jgi:hypothetical protein